jgi:simple sugar transport system ATP-binding protein
MPVIALRHVTKLFPGVVANRDISLEIGREIHAIVGENGAGKSTLMRILSGLQRPDSGEIWIRGKKVSIIGPRHALKLGIGMVHQHFMLVGRFTVLENVILGAEPAVRGQIDYTVARVQVSSLLERYGFALDPEARISDLSVGQQQQIEILKVLYRGADILILDEPTSVLAPREVMDLFTNLKALAASGKTVIFISHKLDEVLEIADRISVLRRGQLIGTVDSKSATRQGIAQMMVGRPVLFSVDKPAAAPGEVLLETKDLTVPGRYGRAACNSVSLHVRAGEVFGIAGVEGNGQSELVEAIVGLRKPTGGTVKIAGIDVTGAPTHQVRAQGLAHIPEDRQRRGLVLQMSVLENLILGAHRRADLRKRGGIDFSRASELAKDAISRYDIRLPSVWALAATLSGGNQQKLILSRELSGDPKVVIAAQPERGLDVGAAEFVRSRLLDARSRGCAVLLVSADLEELMALSDRIGVMFSGRMVAEMDRKDATVELVGRYMLGPDQETGTDQEVSP